MLYCKLFFLYPHDPSRSYRQEDGKKSRERKFRESRERKFFIGERETQSLREERDMKNCELCKSRARAYCESDQASLCWDCDAKVHGANFLVARHSRSLLCHRCQNPTPWKASGGKLGHTVSMCERCVGEKSSGREQEESEGANEDEIDAEEGLDEVVFVDDDDEEEEEEEEEIGGCDDEDGDNQVVPWSSTPLPPAASSSSSEESAALFSLKRRRENTSDLRFQDDLNYSPSQQCYGSLTAMAAPSGTEGEATSVDSQSRPLKDRRTEPDRLDPVQGPIYLIKNIDSASIVDR